MRRRRSEDAGSLELLLDTMCNAFGGVMFIAMLLAVLSQFIETRTDAATKEKDVARRRERVNLKIEEEKLKARLNGLKASLDAEFRLHVNRPLLAGIERAKKRNAELVVKRDALRKAFEAAGAKLDGAREEKRKRESAVEEMEKENRDTLNKLDRLKRDVVRQLRLPRIRKVRKIPFWMIVKGNRLYLLHKPTRRRSIGPLNAEAVRRKSFNGYAEYEAIQGRGEDLKGDWRNSADVAAILRDLPKRSYLLEFAVWPDSYGAFLKARDFFTQKGYDYFWIIIPGTSDKLRLQFVNQDWFEGL